MRLLRRQPRVFDVQVHDMNVRVRAAVAGGTAARTNALAYWDQLSTYAGYHPEILTSTEPVEPDRTASPMVREMARIAAAAGVGPAVCLRAPVVDHVGRFLAQEVDDVQVSLDDGHYVLASEPRRITAMRQDDGDVVVVVTPEHGPVGVAISVERGGTHGVAYVAVAESCTRATCVVEGMKRIVARGGGHEMISRYVARVPGVRGVLVIREGSIVVLGDVNIYVGEVGAADAADAEAAS